MAVGPMCSTAQSHCSASLQYCGGAGVLLDTGPAGDTYTGDEVSVVCEYRKVSMHGGKGCDPVWILKFRNTLCGRTRWSIVLNTPH